MGRDRARDPDFEGGVKEPNVKEIRLKLGMSQPEFADKFGINLHTLRSWEQGRNTPTGAARALLVLIMRHPDEVLSALAAA